MNLLHSRLVIAVLLIQLPGLSHATPPQSGWISVVSTPPGAAITIDNQKVNQPTNATFALAPGAHTVVISGGPSKLSCAVTVTVKSGETSAIQCPQ